MRKILITGGMGQVGSYLVDRLQGSSDLTVLDDLSSKSRYVLPENVRLVKEDIRSSVAKDLVSEHDVVIHAAAQISVKRSMDDPLFDADTNIFGTLNLLEGARKADLEKFIYFSSAAVYGNPEYLAVDEEHPVEPMSPYGTSKLCGEKYCTMYNAAYGLPAVCIRPFNIYSPRQDPSNPYSGVISRFIDRARQGLSPVIFGDGMQTRDFVSVHDVVDMVVLLTEDQDNNGEVFNVGTGVKTSIIELACLVMELFGLDADIEFQESQKGDIRDSYSDITRARGIGYSPQVGLKRGLEEIIESLTEG